MKKINKNIDILIVIFCRVSLSLFVTLLSYKIMEIMTDNQFTLGIVFGITMWNMMRYTKTKITL